MSEPSRRELLNIVYKLDLYSFVQRSFGVLEPGNRFMPAAYLDLLCAALMQVDARAVKRLIINTPPRHLKSFVTSVVFPAWLLMRDPKTKIAVICHATCSPTTWRRNASASSSPMITGRSRLRYRSGRTAIAEWISRRRGAAAFTSLRLPVASPAVGSIILFSTTP